MGGLFTKLRDLLSGEKRTPNTVLQPAPDSAIRAPSRIDHETAQADSGVSKEWQTDRPALLEAIWGKGWHLPLGEELTEILVRATGLTKEMSVLDLSAGLGGMARKVATDYKTYVTGFEPDEALAQYAAQESKRLKMALTASVSVYDPETYKVGKLYDCVFVRELFFRVKDRQRFIKAVAKSLKNYGQICWTDFIAEKDKVENKALVAWRNHEIQGRKPMTLEEVKKLWDTLGYDLRVAEDQTERYMRGILMPLGRFVQFLQGHKVSQEAKLLILAEIELWARRVAALDDGLVFYRFYALKK